MWPRDVPRVLFGKVGSSPVAPLNRHPNLLSMTSGLHQDSIGTAAFSTPKTSGLPQLQANDEESDGSTQLHAF